MIDIDWPNVAETSQLAADLPNRYLLCVHKKLLKNSSATSRYLTPRLTESEVDTTSSNAELLGLFRMAT